MAWAPCPLLRARRLECKAAPSRTEPFGIRSFAHPWCSRVADLRTMPSPPCFVQIRCYLRFCNFFARNFLGDPWKFPLYGSVSTHPPQTVRDGRRPRWLEIRKRLRSNGYTRDACCPHPLEMYQLYFSRSSNLTPSSSVFVQLWFFSVRRKSPRQRNACGHSKNLPRIFPGHTSVRS